MQILTILWLSSWLALGGQPHAAAAAPTGAPEVQVLTTTLTIPTYPYANFLEPQHSDIYNMTYYRLNWSEYEASNPQPSPHDYTAVVVENNWLRLTFLPELGGRLYGVTVKATGEELLYQNPVIKPTRWGPPEQGWWLAAGGIEWCLPVEEHGYEWGEEWYYSVSTTAQGATVWLWDTFSEERVRAEISVHLPADRAAFTVTPRLENPTGDPVTFEFWDNAMLAPGAANTIGPELRFVVPIDQVTVHSRGDGYLPGAGEPMSWPTYNSTDYSRLGNWNQWLGFFARPQAAQDWAGVYAEGVKRGVARVFPKEVAVGVKGFGFGWSNPIDPDTWTDDDSMYVELHGGPAPTFWDAITLNPGQTLEWTETWLPLRDIPTLSLATPNLALGLQASGADLDLGAVLARGGTDISLRLWRQADCTPLWHQDGLSLAPGEAYTAHLAGIGLAVEEVVLGVLEGSSLLALSGDLTCPAVTSQVDALGTVQTTPDFTVQWSAGDPGGVLTSYDIQARDGDAEAPWIDWLTATTSTPAIFHGQEGHTYSFRSRARDLWGQVERWPTGGWEDTFTTVLLEPAPVLITSDKIAWPVCVSPGDQVEFQIHLDNTGNLSTTVQMTDPLPVNLAVTAGPWISPTLPPPALISSTVTWSGTLTAGQTGVTIGFTAQVLDIQPGGAITNTAWIDYAAHPSLQRRAVLRQCLRLYLPLILKYG
ncbi:MAG: DUF5107 domain-containing protein [Anaerolineae bacterium]|nr:DUF5107 domain-containing protein [Anaerolineae bacterium]